MPRSEIPCLSIAIARLKVGSTPHGSPADNAAPANGLGTPLHDPPPTTKYYAIWVLKAPYPGGYVHHDCIWSDALTQIWQAWQQMFSVSTSTFEVPPRLVATGENSLASPNSPKQSTPQAKDLQALPSPVKQLQPTEKSISNTAPLNQHPSFGILPVGKKAPEESLRNQNREASSPNFQAPATRGVTSYSARLMQQLGLTLWQWLFDGAIQSSFAQSIGIAIGQKQPLRLRLDIRDPDLITLPWEIMQPGAGKPAISLNPQVRFSRTTSDVDPLSDASTSPGLNILLVLGENPQTGQTPLQLEKEAATLVQILEQCSQTNSSIHDPAVVESQVDTLIQPTPAELIESLETGGYNIFFYAGHGVPAPDGGQLLLRPGTTLSGTELAQVLVSSRVTLAVFNACWGAQPDRHHQKESQGEMKSFLARSSLAEVLIHHGVPAVLAMRDSITDQEALSFIQAFTQVLAERMPIDQAVAVARQQLLTLYKFNQPAWTLPVLYMHPEFDGELIQPLESLITELPENSTTQLSLSIPMASLKPVGGQLGALAVNQVWPIRGGRLSVGRRSENDLVIQERWVSQKHAEIFCRDLSSTGNRGPTYFLRDFSRYGTLILGKDGWQKVHHQEVPLQSGNQLKFGSSQGLTLEFVIEG